jgi:hypothetical protein
MSEPNESIYDEWHTNPEPDPRGTQGKCSHWPGQPHCDICGYTAAPIEAQPATPDPLDAAVIAAALREHLRTGYRCSCRKWSSGDWEDHAAAAIIEERRDARAGS